MKSPVAHTSFAESTLDMMGTSKRECMTERSTNLPNAARKSSESSALKIYNGVGGSSKRRVASPQFGLLDS